MIEGRMKIENGVLISFKAIDTEDGYEVPYGFFRLDAVIPEGVTEIAPKAFYYMGDENLEYSSYLKSVTLPESLRKIGKDAFYGCNNLEEIRIPEGVEEIGPWAFANCEKLKKIKFPDKIRVLNPYVVYACSSLESFEMPSCVERIGEGAFAGCTSLKSIKLPKNLTEISESLFSKCESLSQVLIPKTITKIGRYAFARCESLESISLPETLTRIDEFAFSGCLSLRAIRIPAACTEIGEEAFTTTPSVAEIKVDPKNPVYDSRDDCNAIVRTLDNTIVLGSKATVIPDGITAIGKKAFYGCGMDHGHGVHYGNLIITNEFGKKDAFSNHIADDEVKPSLFRKIHIPDSVTSIGDFAFHDCFWLEEINLPDHLTYIGTGSFCNCENLKELAIPSGVLSLGDVNFLDCYSLKKVYLSHLYIGDFGWGIFDKATDLYFKLNKGELIEEIKRVHPDKFQNRVFYRTDTGYEELDFKEV